jgi:chloramphenicol-sensitive protein RarD
MCCAVHFPAARCDMHAMTVAMTPAADQTRNGLIFAAAAYGLWGFLPLYFKLLGELSPFVILAHRIVWSVPTALIAVAIAGRLGDFLDVVRRPRALALLAASSALIAANWTIYIWAVTSERVLEGSLGYFINPLVTFLFAAIFFGERFNPVQLAALGLAGLGVLNQTLVVGAFPWVSLSLAVSFAAYGAIRKTVPVDSRVGFGIEAGLLAPFALAFLLLAPAAQGVFTAQDLALDALLVLAGPVTAIPLILFALGAKRLRMSTIAMLQYIAPTLQFVLGLSFGEPFTLAHAATFGLIWTGVALFTVEVWRIDRRRAIAAG